MRYELYDEENWPNKLMRSSDNFGEEGNGISDIALRYEF